MNHIAQQHDVDVGAAVAKMGVGAGGVVWYSLTLNEWVAVVTIAYFVIQIVILLPKLFATIKGWVKR